MKPIAVLAAVLIGIPAAQRPPQRPPQTPAQRERPAREPRGAEPLLVLNAERAWAGIDTLWPIASPPPRPSPEVPSVVRDAAVHAIGRLEDPRIVPQLLTLPGVSPSTTADAIAQSLQGFDPIADSALLSSVEQWLRMKAGGESATTLAQAFTVAALSTAMGRIAYASADQVRDAEEMLSALAANTAHDPLYAGAYAASMRALESLARVNTKLVALDKMTLERLGHSVRGAAENDHDDARRYALLALIAARALDPDTERRALADDDWQVRRSAMAVLAGAGAGFDDDTRLVLISQGLRDESPHVRYEAVRAYARHAAAANGCQPLLDAIKDEDTSVAVQALDLLGTLCKDSDDVTTRLTAEARVPSAVGSWHRETHAFVSLAKRSPEAAALEMEAFVTHPVWWVRMYSAFAAAGAKDLLHLEKLAYDDNDNIREAALPHLRRLDPDRADRAIVAALDRDDVQLIRTAALMVKEFPQRPTLLKPLLGALQRLTKNHGMTSRDGRLALLDAIDRHAKPQDYQALMPWLKDYDSKIAEGMAAVLVRLGQSVKADPQPAAHIPSQPFDDLQQCVTVNMSPGKPIRLRMDPASAPIAVEQFLKLATIDKYYNGLTFHRVVPNFVIQGGSPNANEYSGARDYMRDEIAAPNVRGTVGLSTRGRNTGDAQFFINLVDNPRLNGQYTVFAQVFPDDMDAVDQIQEGDVMRSIDSVPCGQPPRRR